MRTGKTIFYMLCLLCGWQVSAQELAVSESLPVDGKEGRYVEKAGNQALIYAGELEPLYLNRLEGLLIWIRRITERERWHSMGSYIPGWRCV